MISLITVVQLLAPMQVAKLFSLSCSELKHLDVHY